MLLLWILIVNCILSIIYIVSGHKRTQSTIIKLRVERKNGTFIIWQQMIAYIHCPLLLWQFDGIDRANNMIRVPLLCKLQYILFFQRKLSIRKNSFWRGIKSESFFNFRDLYFELFIFCHKIILTYISLKCMDGYMQLILELKIQNIAIRYFL